MDGPTHNRSPDWRAEFRRLDGAYAPATMRSYRADVEAYEAWCLQDGAVSFPASEATLCRFLEAEGQCKAPSTVRRRLYAIRKVHRLLGLSDPTGTQEIVLTLRRISRAHGIRPRQARGLTRPHLERFLALQPGGLLGLRNRAMLALGYELLTRRAELVVLTLCDLDWRTDGTLRVLIRRSKSDPFGAGRIGFTSQATASLVADWLAARDAEIRPLFCPVYHGKPIDRALSVDTVKRLVKSTARRAGLDPELAEAFSGHSLRVGAAQDLLTRGHDTAAIMRAGGWKSVAVLARYLEEAEHNVWA